MTRPSRLYLLLANVGIAGGLAGIIGQSTSRQASLDMTGDKISPPAPARRAPVTASRGDERA